MPSVHSKLNSSLKLPEKKESQDQKPFQQAGKKKRKIKSVFDHVHTCNANYSLW